MDRSRIAAGLAASLADLLGEEDPRIEHMLGMQAVAAHWRELPPRDRTILVMRFYGDMTQAQIGQQFGLFQMHVSRLIARARAISAGVSSISRTAPSLPPPVRK